MRHFASNLDLSAAPEIGVDLGGGHGRGREDVGTI